jgi:mitochondrial fission protein ELM1
LNIDGSRRIGLLLGGPTRGIPFGVGQIERLVQDLLKSSEELEAQLLVTSSRRTPPEVEERLKQMLGDHPRCRLLTLVNRNDPGGLEQTAQAVPCILGLCQVLVVSGDSISMVSEAVAALKPVVGFLAKDGNTKYHRFLRGLDAQGKVRMVSPEGVGAAVLEAMDGRPSSVVRRPSSISDPVVEFLTKWL